MPAPESAFGRGQARGGVECILIHNGIACVAVLGTDETPGTSPNPLAGPRGQLSVSRCARSPTGNSRQGENSSPPHSGSSRSAAHNSFCCLKQFTYSSRTAGLWLSGHDTPRVKRASKPSVSRRACAMTTCNDLCRVTITPTAGSKAGSFKNEIAWGMSSWVQSYGGRDLLPSLIHHHPSTSPQRERRGRANPPA